MRCYLVVVLICISLKTCDVEYFVMYLWPFVYILWEKYLFGSLAQFLKNQSQSTNEFHGPFMDSNPHFGKKKNL